MLSYTPVDLQQSMLSYTPVGLDGGGRVLHLHVLVAHERPGPQAAGVQLEGPLEVQRRLLMLGAQAVVVTCTQTHT